MTDRDQNMVSAGWGDVNAFIYTSLYTNSYANRIQ